MKTFICSCGKRHKGTITDAQGLRVSVRTLDGEWFLVPRIYIEVHGYRASDLPVLARRYGWEQTSAPRPGNRKKQRTWAK